MRFGSNPNSFSSLFGSSFGPFTWRWQAKAWQAAQKAEWTAECAQMRAAWRAEQAQMKHAWRAEHGRMRAQWAEECGRNQTAPFWSLLWTLFWIAFAVWMFTGGSEARHFVTNALLSLGGMANDAAASLFGLMQ
ncbi:hypothetical protein [Paludibaculum fermentans]|uniref:hypothetical protein n=1 Tax=Paludibaculum fermentans TaxID=1473598 RepID=UPI003EB9F723